MLLRRLVRLWAYLAISVAQVAFGDSGLPEGYESYSERPSILAVTPRGHPGLGEHWERLKIGHLEAAAQMIELYPESELVFLARDGELLHDTVKLLLKNEPGRSARVHLVNVSRANMRADHLNEYLAQFGVTEERLRSGQKVVLIDTGFSGTIPRVLGEGFSPEARGAIRTHLICSANELHPSSRVFLTALNPAAPGLDPGTLHGTIVSYEHLPRFTDRSTRFEKVQGRWEALSPARSPGGVAGMDGTVDRNKALQYMEDLAHWLEDPQNLDRVAEKRALWRSLREAARDASASADSTVLLSRLRMLLTSPATDPFGEATVRDFLESLERNLKLQFRNKPTLADLGLKRPVWTERVSNKNELIKKFPQWGKLLEDPHSGIRMLIQKGDFATLGAVIDVIVDEEFVRLLAGALGEAPVTPPLIGLLSAWIEKGDAYSQRALAFHAFSNPNSGRWGDALVLEFIEKADGDALWLLGHSAFANFHAAQWSETVVRRYLAKADGETLRRFATDVFSQPHSVKWGRGVVHFFIEQATPDSLWALAGPAYSWPHAGFWGPEVMRHYIERADAIALDHLEMYAFSRKEFQGAEWEVYRKAASIKEIAQRRLYLLDRLGPMPLAEWLATGCSKSFGQMSL